VSVVALTGGGLLVLEHVGTGGATGQPSKVQTNARPTTTLRTTSTTITPPQHCGNGLGIDNPKNKHCRPASGA
jgi:hypothetical protein